MIVTRQEYKERQEKIKGLIIKLLFVDKKHIVTEVTIKKEVSCYNVNIEAIIREINDLKSYPVISCIKNSYGVLSLQV